MSIKLHHIKTLIVYSFVIFILPVCWLPLFLYRQLVLLLVRLGRPDLGKIFNQVDIICEETGIQRKGYVPKSSIVSSLTLDEPISVLELRDLFQRNVLERRATTTSTIPNSKITVNCNNNNNNNDKETKVRYPELKQFPVSFMGYSFWKQDEHFKIEDHIVEQFYENGKQPTLSKLHQDMINKSFLPRQTPWEIVLINNFKDGDHDDQYDDGYPKNRAFIIARFHHSMADAKSILKLFVECLGEKSLTTARPQLVKSSYGIMDLVKVPINYAVIISYLVKNTVKYWGHPWKCNRSSRKLLESQPQLVRLSAKLSLQDVKEIGRKSGGSGASVIIAIISGAINRVRPDLGEMYSVYILPKDNHPETLGNHARFGAFILPTGDALPVQRLQKSHQVFRELKAINMGEYLDYPLSTVATVFNPLRAEIAWELMSSSPIGITNIAGEGDGFSVGKRTCSEFIFSVGTLLGDTGLCFCISSYKAHFRIALISQGEILDETEMDRLASMMGVELESLKRLTISLPLPYSVYNGLG